MSAKPAEKINRQSDNRSKLAFGKENYRIMLIGLAVIVAGLVIMSLDSEPYGFGFAGLTLGPIVLMLGFVIEFFAILRTPKRNSDTRS